MIEWCVNWMCDVVEFVCEFDCVVGKRWWFGEVGVVDVVYWMLWVIDLVGVGFDDVVLEKYFID